MTLSLGERFRDHWFHKVRVPLYLARIRPGDRVVDAGANVGLYTGKFADRGATVYAFEPHPAAFAKLVETMRARPNVICLNKAVSDKAGAARLYLHREGDSLPWSQSASLLADKCNVDPRNFVAVETVRLADFIAGIAPVRFMKLDIEGAEYDVLQDMIDTGQHRNVKLIVVETHERKAPSLRSRHQALLARIRRERIRNIHLDWV